MIRPNPNRYLITTSALTLLAASAARADFNPVPLQISSFNQDIVVERTAPGAIGRATTASMDSGTNNNGASWYELGYNTAAPATGLPAAGSTFTSAASTTHQFQMAPTYATNNAALIDPSIKTATWVLTAPAVYTNLSFLTSGGHNGLTNVGVIIHHADNSTERGFFASPDWFNGTAAYTANGRVNVQTMAFDNVNAGNPRLYSRDITVTNVSSPVTSIDFTNQSFTGGDVGIFAVSGAAPNSANWLPITVTGYSYDMIVEASAPTPVLLTGVTTATMDSGPANTLNTWFEAGYDSFYTNAGLPRAGATFTSTNQADHHYTMPASYTANNAALIDSSSTTASLTPVTPAPFSALSFLGAADNGAVSVACGVQHQDGSTENFTISMPDWISSSPVAYYVNGRINLNTRTITNEFVSPINMRLYEPQIALANTTSAVTNIALTWSSGGTRAAFFALSGTAGSVPPIISSSPTNIITYDGPTELFSATVSGGTLPMTFHWQKSTNGVFYNLVDGGNISGSLTTNLTVANVDLVDSGDYRLVVSNVVGAVNSGVGNLLVLSSLPDVTAPGDTITSYGSALASPVGEDVTQAINDNTSKYLNYGGGTTPFSGVAGLVVTPAMGLSRVTVMRIYTANDVPGRDPAAYLLEGSTDGGNTYTTISSGPLALPDGRNNAALAIDPTTQYMQQVSFANTAAYSTYRLSFNQVKSAPLANSCQIGELELLGVSVNLSISVTPDFQNVSPGANVQFVGIVSPVDLSTSYRWQKFVNGAYVNLTDNTTVSGSTTDTLSLNNVSFNDSTSYLLVVSNSSTIASSSPVLLNVLSSSPDVTSPLDTIAIYNGTSPAAEVVSNAIDNTTGKYLNYGTSGTTAAPFVGPVGFVVTPAMGATLVNAYRVYTANDTPARDPLTVTLEGSNNGGTSYTLITSNTLALPVERNAAGLALDPATQPLQEVHFSNTKTYTSYRFIVYHVKSDASANSMQLGEVELLGGTAVTATITHGSGNSLIIGSSTTGTLQSSTNLKSGNWKDEGSISGSVTITPQPGEPAKYFRVRVP
jgi:hypothetical protein